MKKKLVLFSLFILFSCNTEKEVQLPQAEITLEKTVVDHSPVYIFFETNGKDTIAQLNRKNTIGTTNWLFNIDKRLTLKYVIPHVQFMQAKKLKGMHVNAQAKNYFSYFNSIDKSLAFLSFTNINYQLKKPNDGIQLYFRKGNKVLVNDTIIQKEEIEKVVNKLNTDYSKVQFCFDKNLSFDEYIKYKIFITKNIELKYITFNEYIY